MQGKIIVIDGMDGCGKQTQSELLLQKLLDKNYKVKLFSFPNYDDDSSYFVKKFLNEDYKDIDNPYMSTLFFSIDRGITFFRDIKKYYDKGYYIILDRYYISNALYHIPQLDSQYKKINYISYLGIVELDGLNLPKADITIILSSDPIVSNDLLNNRYNNEEEKRDIYENLDMQYKVWNSIKFIDNYKDLISFKSVLGPIHILSIHNDKNEKYSIEEMNEKIMRLV